MAHLLQVMGVWDVLVVVSRWYGGVKLGPDRFAPLCLFRPLPCVVGGGNTATRADFMRRFRLINAAAREALVMGGFVKGEDGEKKVQQKKGQKGKSIKPA